MNATGITSQSELSRLSGVNQSIISKILRGQNETSKYSGKLAAALGISADWLINGSGSMNGASDSVIEKVDVSRLVNVWDENGCTDDAVSWFESVPAQYRAYVMKKNTGIIQAPAGSILLVDPSITPGNNDLVVTIIREEVSVFRYLEAASGFGFLAVDDGRLPPSEIQNPDCIAGVVMQILVRRLRK